MTEALSMDDAIVRLPAFTRYPTIEGTRLTATSYQWWHYGLAAWHQKGITGRGIKIGVCDTGIDSIHAQTGELAGRIESVRSFNSASTSGKDYLGHGTHVASIIAGRPDGKGASGVAPESTLCIAAVLKPNGSGPLRALIEGMQWCADQGCQIINASLGTPQQAPQLRQLIAELNSSGILIPAAAGNDANAVDDPAGAPDAFAIGAINQQDQLAPFSDRGPQIDLAHPGMRILGAVTDGNFAYMDGTSQAAPHVAGSFALRLQAEKEAVGHFSSTSRQRMLAALKGNTIDLGSAGRDQRFGLGRIDYDKFLNLKVAPGLKKLYRMWYGGSWIEFESSHTPYIEELNQ